MVVTIAVAFASLGAASRSRAELVRPRVPTLTWGAGIEGWMPPHEERSAGPSRSSVVWTPSFAAFSIGVSGQASFRSATHVQLLRPVSMLREPWTLCIGPTCPGRASVRADGAVVDADASAKAGSMRLITDMGPLAVAALGLFSNPVATEAHPVVMRVAPMFAFGGGGLEMRCAWW